MADRLYLIDGHALIFRMYYAFMRRPMVNSKGQDTSILFGFTKYLLELIQKRQPTHIAVAFDPPGGTFRNEMYPEYKANRAETPQLVIDALEPLTEIVSALNIPVLLMKGFEADDVIGSLAKRSAREGVEVYMVTPDKDYGQLIEPSIFQIKPGKAGEDDVVFGVQQVCEKYGICNPSQVIEMLTICGDTADNVPGVKGVGEVGASKLISKYGSVEGIYAHIDELTARQQEMFREAEGHIRLSHDLVTIKTDIDVPVTLEQMRLDSGFSPRIVELFNEYEFPSLRRFISHVKAAPGTAAAGNPSLRPEALRQVSAADFAGLPRVAFAPLGEGDEELIAVAGSAEMPDRWTSADVSAFAGILADSRIVKCTYGAKDLLKLASSRGIKLGGKLEDVELMHYLTDPERSHKLDMLAQSMLGLDVNAVSTDASADPSPEAEPDLFGGGLFDTALEEEPVRVRSCAPALAVYALSGKLRAQMEQKGCADLYDKIEEPLIAVLARMELTGVKVDLDSLREFAESLRGRIAQKEALVRELADEPALNVASPKQIGEIIFEKLRLDPKAKKASGRQWPTDEETLSALADKSPIIDAILEYRGSRKLLNTYIEPFPGYISPKDGRIHTTFNQALTSTGRLSSSNPNLQNIPIRSDEGKEIRKAFVAQNEGWVIMSADYSQIELRIMAHLSGDEHLIAAFREGVDVHAATASKIFRVPVGDVTSDQRRFAKTANFGIMYGISSFGLAQRLHCSRSDAKQLIDDYFDSFPAIRSFIDRTLADARERGYVETLFGRRRYIPEITASNVNIRSLAERNAVNAPIQGTSADIIKKAMIAVDERMRREGLASRMVLQIHDELLFEVPPQEIDVMTGLVREEMESVLNLSVPLTVECSYGKNWLEAH